MAWIWLCLLLTCITVSSGFDWNNFKTANLGVYNFEQIFDDSKPSVSINGNKFVDNLIKAAKPELAEFQKTYKPSDFKGEFHKRYLFVRVSVQYHGYDGHINGLTTLYRYGDVKVTANKNLLTLELGLGLREPELSYTLHVDAHLFRTTKKMKVTVSGIAVRAVIVKDLHKYNSPRLQSLKVTDVGKGHCHVSGLGFVSDMVDSITTKIFNNNRNKMASAGEKALTKVLSEELSKIKF